MLKAHTVRQPPAAEISDTVSTGRVMSNGLSEPYLALSAPTVVGISWIDAVFSTVSIAMFLLAYLLPLLLILLTAEIPRGVAAFEMPSIFAVRFIEMFFIVSPSHSLNSLLVTGESRKKKNAVIPAFCAIRIRPPHKAIAPAR